MALHVGHNCNPWEKCNVYGAEVEPQYRQRTDVCAVCRQGFTLCRCRHQLREWKEKQAMRDKLEDAFLRLRAAAHADEYVPMEDVIEVVLKRLNERDEARRVCQMLADWWYVRGIEGTTETDEIAAAARRVLLSLEEKP